MITTVIHIRGRAMTEWAFATREEAERHIIKCVEHDQGKKFGPFETRDIKKCLNTSNTFYNGTKGQWFISSMEIGDMNEMGII